MREWILEKLKSVFVKHWKSKLLCIVLASLLWGYVQQEHNPLETKIFFVKLNFENKPIDLEPKGNISEIALELEGASNIIEGLKPENIDVVIDLKGSSSGRTDVTIKPEMIKLPKEAKEFVKVIKVTPPKITVDLESTAKRTVRINPLVIDQPADGYEITGVTAEPDKVEIRGPKSAVNAISEMRPPIEINGAKRDFESTIELDIGKENVKILGETTIKVQIKISRKE